MDRKALPDPFAGAALPSGVVYEEPKAGLESILAGMWRNVLGVERVGRHDNFFDLGGHSLLAIRFLADIERRIGRDIPLSTLFQAPTVGQLAELIDAEFPSRRWTSLTPVQPSGSGQPFFYVAPYLITALSFVNMGRSFGDDQPLYVFQPQGMETDDPPHQSVEEMAAHYITEMREVQPEGPYAIGGHCAGSPVALEMAGQLQDLGQDVSVLVLVDAAPPHVPVPKVSPLRYVPSRLAYYLGDGRLRPALAWWWNVTRDRVFTRRFGAATGRRLAELRAGHAKANARYRGRVIKGDATLIRSSEWNRSPDNDWHLRWSELIGGELRLGSVAGTHAELVEVANSADLAVQIVDLLAGRDRELAQ